MFRKKVSRGITVNRESTVNVDYYNKKINGNACLSMAPMQLDDGISSPIFGCATRRRGAINAINEMLRPSSTAIYMELEWSSLIGGPLPP